ncbi:hypothetical protein M5K25_026109 [Dendrobium thyrsiflorum]|uniref:Uncharacterized protein n=1 Tax=Dendrobium thyrsiflorum TaxID=117978 RepID=A0ABD0TWL7_DENTH
MPLSKSINRPHSLHEKDFLGGEEIGESSKVSKLRHRRRRTTVDCRRPPPDFHLANSRHQNSARSPLEARRLTGSPPQARHSARLPPQARHSARLSPQARHSARLPPQARRFARPPLDAGPSSNLCL